jgi:hypothetical protein
MIDQQPLTSVNDLRPSEKRFLTAMQQLGYGSFESLRICDGELVLDPLPTTVRSVKFGNATSNQPNWGSSEFELKKQFVAFFAYVRGVDAGVIRVLEIRGGLPFAMEIVGGHDSA